MKHIEYETSLIEGGNNSVSGIHYRIQVSTCTITNRIISILDRTGGILNKLMWQHKEYHYDRDNAPFDDSTFNQVFFLEFKDGYHYDYFIYELDKAIDDIMKLELIYLTEVQ